MNIRSLLVIAGWVVGVLAFAVVVATLEHQLKLSLGAALGVGASVALIWVTRTYVLATQRMALDQATLVEIQRRAPYIAGLTRVWEMSIRSMWLTAEVKTDYEYGATSARSHKEAMEKLDEARISANELSQLASELLAAAGGLDPTTSHAQMVADQSIALLKFTSTVMPSISEAVDLLSTQKRAGLGHRLSGVPSSFTEASDLVEKAVGEFTSAINDELGRG